MERPKYVSEPCKPQRNKSHSLEFPNYVTLDEIIAAVPSGVNFKDVTLTAHSHQRGFSHGTDEEIEIEYTVVNTNYEDELINYEFDLRRYQNYVKDLAEYERDTELAVARNILKKYGATS